MLSVGSSVTREWQVTSELVAAFAAVSGDYNPLHSDESFAAGTRFGRPVAHGMLAATLISSVIATELPGAGTVYLKQNLNFRAPVYVNELVKVSVSCLELRLSNTVARLSTTVLKQDGTVAIDGEALVLLPSENNQ